MLESSNRRRDSPREISQNVLSKCGSQLPDDAAFCSKCGARTSSTGQTPQVQSSVGTSGSSQILALSNAQSLKCPSCGAPIAPKFGEMIIIASIVEAA